MRLSVMSFDSVVKSLRHNHLGAEVVSERCATFGDDANGPSVQVLGRYLDGVFSHVEVSLALGPLLSSKATTMYVRESFTDFAGAILRREIDHDAVVAPWQDVEEVIRRAFGRERIAYADVYFAIIESLRDGGFVFESANSTKDRSDWQCPNERSMHLVKNDDETVTLAFIDNDGEMQSHVIVESTTKPYVVELKRYGDVRSKSGSCTLANAIDAAKGFIEVGFDR